MQCGTDCAPTVIQPLVALLAGMRVRIPFVGTMPMGVHKPCSCWGGFVCRIHRDFPFSCVRLLSWMICACEGARLLQRFQPVLTVLWGTGTMHLTAVMCAAKARAGAQVAASRLCAGHLLTCTPSIWWSAGCKGVAAAPTQRLTPPHHWVLSCACQGPFCRRAALLCFCATSPRITSSLRAWGFTLST